MKSFKNLPSSWMWLIILLHLVCSNTQMCFFYGVLCAGTNRLIEHQIKLPVKNHNFLFLLSFSVWHFVSWRNFDLKLSIGFWTGFFLLLEQEDPVSFRLFINLGNKVSIHISQNIELFLCITVSWLTDINCSHNQNFQ